MEINEKVEYLIEKILSFSGTEKYYTRDYIGFKVNSKLYLELEPRKTLIRLCVSLECSPILGSSKIYIEPTRGLPSEVASAILWLSPPERVELWRLSDR